MNKFEYRLGNPIPSIREPADSVTLKDYYDFFSKYVNMRAGSIYELIPPNVELKNRNGQEYFIVSVSSEKSADSAMNVFNQDFKTFIIENKKVDKDVFGVSLERLAKINYVKNNTENIRPVSAFHGAGITSSGYYDD
jgi:hypothetical protein